jgi:TonB family protein
MQQLGHVAVLITVFFGMLAALAAEPNADAPPELEFAAPCKTIPAEPFASGPTTLLPRFTPGDPPRQPPYPAKFRERSVLGTIHMLLLVNEQGRVTRVRLVQSTGYPELDQIGLESTRDWKLAPGTVDGKAQCMWQQFTLTWGSTPAL